MYSYDAVDGISRLSVVQNLDGFLPLIFISEIIGLTIVIMIVVWMGVLREGGFGWTKELVFFYHPLFMVLGMIFIYGNALLVYRVFRNSPKIRIKWLHGILNLLCFAFSVVGLKAVFDAHRMSNANNLYSLHSWVGLGCVILFGGQWLIGFVSFLFPKLPESMRVAILPIHRVLGAVIFGLAGTSAVLGILDYNRKNTELTSIMMVGNFLGVFIVIFVVLVLFIVLWHEYRRIEPGTEEERIILNE